jgi:putative phosphoesterase
MRAVVLSDTHIADTSSARLDRRLLDAAARADVILHAGDVTGAALLDRLGELAPVHAVLGNNDADLVGVLPETLELELAGARVALVHDAGPRKDRVDRLARRFTGSDLVIFGHSHQPEDLRHESGLRVFNPGSPTQRRRAPFRTYGLLEIDDAQIVDLEHVRLL